MDHSKYKCDFSVSRNLPHSSQGLPDGVAFTPYSQFLQNREQIVFVTTTNGLILFGVTTAVHCDNHAQHINTRED